MSQIYFIRHAKSSWDNMSLSDEERPLNKRGKRDAPFMASKLSLSISKVDLMICSPAIRAQQTMEQFRQTINSKDTITQAEVYHASVHTLLEVLTSIEPSVKTALIFGHNPGFTSMYNYFSNNFIDNLPTCGIFRLNTIKSWSQMTPENTNTDLLIYPKMYQ